MDMFLAMLRLCLSTVGSAILSPVWNMAFVIFVFIVYMQYKKNINLQEIVYGKPKTNLSNLVMTSVLSGMIAGLAISIPIVLAGISFGQDIGIKYMLLISFLLMLIEPRFLCFSYSGGLLALISLIFGFKNIDVTGILMLVGMLHLLESVLIYIDGSRGAIPVFVENADGKVIGGFNMQRFWPIPLALVLFAGFGSAGADTVPTPDWWPILRPYLDPARINEALFAAVPVSAMLGYSEFSSSSLPREKCRNTSAKLALFSIMLLLLAFASSYIYIFKYIAALFAPIAHEGLIRYEKMAERKREPLFLPVKDGIKVLDTMPGGPGEKMGIQPGDTIVAINNRSVVTQEGLYEFFKEYVNYVWVDVRDRYGKIRTLEYKDYREGIDDLEVIAVPRDSEGLITLKERKSFGQRLLKKIGKDK